MEKDCTSFEAATTSDSLLGNSHQPDYRERLNLRPRSKARRRRHRVYLLVGIVSAVILVLLIAVLVLCFADVTYALRLQVSEKLGIALPGYKEPAELSE